MQTSIGEQMVTVGGVDLYVQRITTREHDPTRPTLVFLHDSLGCVEVWRDFPRVLAEAVGMNAIVYDRQGYGKSAPMSTTPRTAEYLAREAEVLFELLDELSVQDVVLFGHSDGGSIALIAGALQPARVKVIVTEGAHVFVEEETLAGVRVAQHAFATTNLATRLARYHGSKVSAIASAWIDTWLSPMFRDWNIVGMLAGGTCPALIIQGENDEYGTPDQVEAIVQGWSGRARPLMLPNAAHTPHREAREETLDESARFIRDALAI